MYTRTGAIGDGRTCTRGHRVEVLVFLPRPAVHAARVFAVLNAHLPVAAAVAVRAAPGSIRLASLEHSLRTPAHASLDLLPRTDHG